MDELLKPVEVLSNPDMMKVIREGIEDIRLAKPTKKFRKQHPMPD